MSTGERTVTIGALFLLLLHSVAAMAASFDCKGAKSAVEKMICSDAILSKLDEDLGNLYARALLAAPDRETMKREQREWVKKSRNQCATSRCLSSSYQARIMALQKYGKNNDNHQSSDEISGVWEEMKPTADGRFKVIITQGKLQLSLCKSRIFNFKQLLKNQYVFTATSKGKCLQYSDSDLNLIKISITDQDRIHAEFYSGPAHKDWLGSDNFIKFE